MEWFCNESSLACDTVSVLNRFVRCDDYPRVPRLEEKSRPASLGRDNNTLGVITSCRPRIRMPHGTFGIPPIHRLWNRFSKWHLGIRLDDGRLSVFAVWTQLLTAAGQTRASQRGTELVTVAVQTSLNRSILSPLFAEMARNDHR